MESASGDATPVRQGGAPQATAVKAKRKRSTAGLRYFLRRTGFFGLTTFFAVTLNFIIPRFMPGDPAAVLVRKMQKVAGITPSPEQVAAIQRFYGDPTENIIGQFIDYWVALFRFDFGVSMSSYPMKVSQLIGVALPFTLLLVGTTTILAWIIGTLIGTNMGWKPHGRVDSWIAPLSTFLHAVPVFWIGLLVLWVFGIQLGWFPKAGGYDPDVPYQLNNIWFLLGLLRYGLLPAGVLVFVGFNGWLFSMRNVMVTTVSEDYVTLARAKGLSEGNVMLRYAARNAILPNVTGLAMAIGGVIGGTLLIETVFTYPGMGYLMQQSILNYDFPVLQTILLMLTLITIVCNYIADMLYGLLDPRTREA
jgi:peptide/nickel transport system permease protein